MLNLTNKDCESMITKSNKRLEGLRSELLLTQSEIRRLNLKQDDIKKSIKNEEKKSIATQEAVILNKSITRKVSTARNVLLSKINRLRREDITIGEMNRLREEVEKLKKEIQQNCNHPFVFHKEGYQGSYPHDHEDGYPSERYCVVCGLEEKAIDFVQNGRVDMVGTVFKMLKTSDDRVVHREPYRPHPKCLSKMEVWVHLAVALKPFEEAVAST